MALSSDGKGKYQPPTKRVLELVLRLESLLLQGLDQGLDPARAGPVLEAGHPFGKGGLEVHRSIPVHQKTALS